VLASVPLPVLTGGTRSLLRAGAAGLLLTLMVLVGLAWSDSAGPLRPEGGASGPVTADGSPPPFTLWGRLTALVQPIRPQGNGLGGSRLDPDPVALPLLPQIGGGETAAPVIPAGRRVAFPPAAGGQLSGRSPTGPPSVLSFIL